jgi:cytochrome c peroxidase
VVGTNAFSGTCATCHNVKGGGNDIFPNSQRDIGIGGHSAAFGGPAPASDLPIFRVTCKPGFAPPFNSPTVLTNDPGRALITGKCADIGARTVPTIRGLASHEPYFSDGSAATISQLVDIYNKRFSIGLSSTEKNDLVNFLKAL